jgi:hypothetical protein
MMHEEMHSDAGDQEPGQQTFTAEDMSAVLVAEQQGADGQKGDEDSTGARPPEGGAERPLCVGSVISFHNPYPSLKV